VKAVQLLRAEELCLQTPTRNPINPFFFGPVVLLHVFFRPAMVVLRSVAVASGLAALAVNWVLCRWVFDGRTAAISTVVLAVLPLDIVYSRFAWDTSQSLLAPLPVWYFCLAAVRFPQRRDRLIAAAILAQVAAVLVHPTNVFAAAAIASALVARLRWEDLKRTGPRRVLNRRVAAGIVLAAIVLAVWMVNLFSTPGPSRLQKRFASLEELVRPQGLPHFWVLYPRLFSGGTVYRYIPRGPRCWLEWPGKGDADGWGADVVLFWAVLAAATWLLWRSWKTEARWEDRTLISAWGLAVVGFWFLAGPRAMAPGAERLAICLIGPTVLVAARGAAIGFGASSPGRRLALAAVSLAGWLVLADYQRHYFHVIEQGEGHPYDTFRTAAVEPKRAALRLVLDHRGAGTTWIVASEWWNYWPLRYFATAEEGIRVATPKEAEDAAGRGKWQRALAEGRVWSVEFYGSQAMAEAEEVLAGRDGRKLHRWHCVDYAGQPVLCVLRAAVGGQSPPRPTSDSTGERFSRSR
jgi:hypothetical protein